MIELSVNKFRANLKSYVDRAINSHEPLKIKRREGKNFVVIGIEDWEREQETLYVLQNSSLIKQITESIKTYNTGGGYRPTQKEMDEIDSI
jgi:antitoxin YefM